MEVPLSSSGPCPEPRKLLKKLDQNFYGFSGEPEKKGNGNDVSDIVSETEDLPESSDLFIICTAAAQAYILLSVPNRTYNGISLLRKESM